MARASIRAALAFFSAGEGGTLEDGVVTEGACLVALVVSVADAVDDDADGDELRDWNMDFLLAFAEVT